MPVFGQVLSDQEISEISRSVVKIYARHNTERAASGFIYGSQDLVVTSLHVVSGADRIQVKISDNGPLIRANIIRVLKDEDLALLRLQSSSQRNPLTSQNISFHGGDEIVCVGYPFNIPSSDETYLRVKSGTKRLRDIIPSQVKRTLDAIGFPNTENIIVNLDGHLLPGHSGAPIFDSNSRVVAISNGGLAVGGASRSWAVSASHLSRLMNSNESIPTISVVTRDLFAEVLSPETENIIIRDNDSEDELMFIRTASYFEMLNTTDDPMGLNMITNTFGALNLTAVTYDIYRDINTGATIVVPGGAEEPYYENDFWVVESPNRITQLFFRIDQGFSIYEVQNESSEFEMDLVSSDQMNLWLINTQWSYPFVRPTLTGMSVRRKAFQKWWSGFPIKQLIVTFSTKDNLLLSSAAKLNDHNAVFQDPTVNFLWFQYSTSAFLTTLAN